MRVVYEDMMNAKDTKTKNGGIMERIRTHIDELARHEVARARITMLAGVVLAAALLMGCTANMSNVHADHAEGDGETQTIAMAPAPLLSAVERTLRDHHAELVEVHPEQGTVYALIPDKAFAYASYLGVWLTPVDATHTRVTAVSRRRVPMGFWTRMTESTFFEELAQHTSSSTTTTNAKEPR